MIWLGSVILTQNNMNDDTPQKRIEKYIKEREKMRNLYGRIHGLHMGHETREAELNAEDIRAVLVENANLREAIKWAEPYVPKRCETRRMIESILPNAKVSQPHGSNATPL